MWVLYFKDRILLRFFFVLILPWLSWQNKKKTLNPFTFSHQLRSTLSSMSFFTWQRTEAITMRAERRRKLLNTWKADEFSQVNCYPLFRGLFPFNMWRFFYILLFTGKGSFRNSFFSNLLRRILMLWGCNRSISLDNKYLRNRKTFVGVLLHKVSKYVRNGRTIVQLEENSLEVNSRPRRFFIVYWDHVILFQNMHLDRISW